VVQQQTRVYLGLLLGVVAVSWAAIFIRLAAAPALSISAYRMAFGATPIAVYALVRGRDELRRIGRRDWLLLGMSGVALALHFATWVASLSRTTVASSVALVTTQPIWVALLAALLLHERMSRRGLGAVTVATFGGVVIAGADLSLRGEGLTGDALALTGGVCAAVYFVAGRSVRQRLSLAAYAGVVYSLAAVLLLLTTPLAGQPLGGFSRETWVMLLLLALIPQLAGHSALNWALRFLSAPAVSVSILGEPRISTALAIP
jgi:drug/metabolite transporter (DMT)-like permease